jgi:RNA polymerase sigma-70 factor (ECF subfamily)
MTLAVIDSSNSTPDNEIDDPADKDFSADKLPTEKSAEDVLDSVNWASLVENISAGDPAAMEELYRLFHRGVRFYLCRQLGLQELDDKIHDTFVIVVQAIRRGELREPERLMGYVRTVVRRQVAAHIDQVVHNRREVIELEDGFRLADIRNNPEESAIVDEQAGLMAQVLRTISRRDREILTRFYLQEQSQEQICEEMGLSETQFRLLKSRAKRRFGELGRQRLLKEQKTQPEKVMRKTTGA